MTVVVGARVAGVGGVAVVVSVTGGAAGDVSDGLGDDDEHDATMKATTTATAMSAPRAGKGVVILPIYGRVAMLPMKPQECGRTRYVVKAQR